MRLFKFLKLPFLSCLRWQLILAWVSKEWKIRYFIIDLMFGLDDIDLSQKTDNVLIQLYYQMLTRNSIISSDWKVWYPVLRPIRKWCSSIDSKIVSLMQPKNVFLQHCWTLVSLPVLFFACTAMFCFSMEVL